LISATGRLRGKHSGTSTSALHTIAGSLAGNPAISLPLDIRPEKALPSGRMTTRETESQLELLQGTLDLLILQTLAFAPAHGHAIARIIQHRSEEVLQVGHGSLYPALQRLLKRGLIVAEDGLSENNRKARFYRLTAKGRKRLSAETSKWQRFASAIARLLTPLPDENPHS
jgi:PadR family transcriptional regulator, regulatory protein PadR